MSFRPSTSHYKQFHYDAPVHEYAEAAPPTPVGAEPRCQGGRGWYRHGRSPTEPRTQGPPRPSDLHHGGPGTGLPAWLGAGPAPASGHRAAEIVTTRLAALGTRGAEARAAS